jgi:hypothetical protein
MAIHSLRRENYSTMLANSMAEENMCYYKSWLKEIAGLAQAR